MNKLLYVYFTEWTKNEHFLRKLKKIFYIIFNEDPSEVVEEIIIRNVSLKGQPPQLRNLWIKKSEDYEFLIDCELTF